VQRMLRSIHEQTARSRTLLSADEVVLGINRALKGWANYFQLGPVSKAYRLLDRYTTSRLRWWLRGKHKVQGAATRRYPDQYLHETLGLVHLQLLTRNLPWAKA
jgi:RNA-directed DNA polymerase